MSDKRSKTSKGALAACLLLLAGGAATALAFAAPRIAEAAEEELEGPKVSVDLAGLKASGQPEFLAVEALNAASPKELFAGTMATADIGSAVQETMEYSNDEASALVGKVAEGDWIYIGKRDGAVISYAAFASTEPFQDARVRLLVSESTAGYFSVSAIQALWTGKFLIATRANDGSAGNLTGGVAALRAGDSFTLDEPIRLSYVNEDEGIVARDCGFMVQYHSNLSPIYSGVSIADGALRFDASAHSDLIWTERPSGIAAIALEMEGGFAYDSATLTFARPEGYGGDASVSVDFNEYVRFGGLDSIEVKVDCCSPLDYLAVSVEGMADLIGIEFEEAEI